MQSRKAKLIPLVTIFVFIIGIALGNGLAVLGFTFEIGMPNNALVINDVTVGKGVTISLHKRKLHSRDSNGDPELFYVFSNFTDH